MNHKYKYIKTILPAIKIESQAIIFLLLLLFHIYFFKLLGRFKINVNNKLYLLLQVHNFSSKGPPSSVPPSLMNGRTSSAAGGSIGSSSGGTGGPSFGSDKLPSQMPNGRLSQVANSKMPRVVSFPFLCLLCSPTRIHLHARTTASLLYTWLNVSYHLVIKFTVVKRYNSLCFEHGCICNVHSYIEILTYFLFVVQSFTLFIVFIYCVLFLSFLSIATLFIVLFISFLYLNKMSSASNCRIDSVDQLIFRSISM